MTIIVSPLSRVRDMISAHAPERVISFADPGLGFPDLGSGYEGRHLRSSFHDTHAETDGQSAPRRAHVDALLGFSAAWTGAAPLLVHCRAGIGRSTAGGYIVACQKNPRADERAVAAALRSAAPAARPNEVLIAEADAALGRNGRMSAAIAEMRHGLPWPDIDENLPFLLSSHFEAATAR